MVSGSMPDGDFGINAVHAFMCCNKKKKGLIVSNPRLKHVGLWSETPISARAETEKTD